MKILGLLQVNYILVLVILIKNIIQLIILKSKNIYGVNFKIVLNYEDAINEITKKNTEKKDFMIIILFGLFIEHI